ncbi:hypothetical protein [Streptomyces iconiensis]|uniref:Integral membrane protein n=1 Tax=Streptomyces iconiensis TaxID=1384038 RepID=A0ABT7A3P2_9ACTN|nr:hypothetical protein [Streptomyces iconiensis]MDJ1135964.1 hypothetical protein [Streptomyces iconiensis]
MSRQHAHSHSRCACDDCPNSAREGYRRALDAFLRRRDELADGQGVPAGLAHSQSASRQWVSDELTESARTVADRGRDEGQVWVARLWKRTVIAVWSAVGALLLGQLVTALASGSGWSLARTAALVAAVVAAGALSVAAWLHRARGGALAPVIGEDNRLSTSRVVAASWVLLAVFAVLLLAAELAGTSGAGDRRVLLEGLDLSRAAGVLTVLALTCGVAVVARRVVAVRVQGRRLQKVRADRPRASDVLTDDGGKGSFSDVQYALVNAVAVTFAAVRLTRRPDELPDLPWGLALLVVVSAATYLAGKYAEGGRPVVLSVVRAREIGDLHAPIRTGDDIEIRGAGFIPPGAGAPDRLARMVVRIGTVHVHVPLIPVAGGFTSPEDATVTVPVPVEVEPGRVEVQVVTAAGVETNRYPIDVVD